MSELPLTTERYELRRVLGRGAAGVVWEAYDRDLGCPVAVKTLRNLEPTALLRLKREFRELADIAHPNLVALHALTSRDGQWLLAMELVEGEPFLEHLRGSEERTEDDSADKTFSDSIELDPVDPVELSQDRPRGRGTLAGDLPRLREAFRQLCEAVAALHAADRLHRDLKPSNVLVSHHGRVVVLDFGLITDAHAEAGSTVVGSAGYMSPEQAGGRALSPASDWYAVGTMLFEALTGQRPFQGAIARILGEKQAVDAPRPSEVCDGVPADLDELCARLLARDPLARPAASEVLAAFGAEVRTPPRRTRLVGREDALGRLGEAWSSVRERGLPALVEVRGRSGFGKSMLVETFLSEVSGDARVLTGRCYERESVPFKALDALADAVVEHLHDRELPEQGASALVELFPVFRRAAGFRSLAPSAIPDPNERRERGFRALSALLVDLSPLVVFVDDVHWGDADSASLFARLARSSAPVLLVFAWRDDEEQTPFLEALEGELQGVQLPRARIELGRIGKDHAAELARQLLPEGLDASAEDIAAAGQGNPMFVHELAQHRAESGELGQVADLDDAILWRVSRLPEHPRRLLELAAISGRPTPIRLLAEAAGIPDPVSDVARLRVARLVRTNGELVSTFHDRVREAVVFGLGERAAAGHAALAEALANTPDPDPEILAMHQLGAERPDAALPLFVAAAERAAASMAFDHAAMLYLRAVDASRVARGHMDRNADRPLLCKRAQMLAYGSRGAEAADLWIQAAEGLTGSEQIRLWQQAGEQLLAAGHVERGLEQLARAHAAVGLSMPPAGNLALAELIPRMAWLRLRGTRFTPRTEPLDEKTALQIDLCWSGVNGLAYIDRYRSGTFQARQLQWALAAGDPSRVARCLPVEGVFATMSGKPADVERGMKLLGRAREVLAEVDDPELHGLEMYCRAIALHFVGDQVTGFELAHRSEQHYRQNCAHVAWQVLRAGIVQGWMAPWLGRFRQHAETHERVTREARRTRNHYAFTAALAEGGWMVWLCRDDPDGLEAALDAVADLGETSIQGHSIGLARAYAHLYRGEPERARTLCEELDRVYSTHLLSQMLVLRLFTDMALLRAHLMASDLGPARKLWKRYTTYDHPLARAIHAMFAARIADVERASDVVDRYRAGVQAMEAIGWLPAVHAGRRRIGELIGGEEGAARITEADAWFTSEDVVRPDRLAAFVLGLPQP